MYEEIKTGGRYFTLKRFKENDTDKLIISVSDVVEMIREIGVNSNFNNHKEIINAVKNNDWEKAIVEVTSGIISKLEDLNMVIPIEFKIDFDSIDADQRDFNYECTNKINNEITTLMFLVKRHGWSSNFIKHFVKSYNESL